MIKNSWTIIILVLYLFEIWDQTKKRYYQGLDLIFYFFFNNGRVWKTNV